MTSMPADSSCPPAERLRRLLAEAPAAPDQAELTAHVGDCAACQRLLDQLAGAGPALLDAAAAVVFFHAAAEVHVNGHEARRGAGALTRKRSSLGGEPGVREDQLGPLP